MNTKGLVHRIDRGTASPTQDARPFTSGHVIPGPSYHQLLGPVRGGILRGRQWLLDQQHHDGSWLGRRHGGALEPSQLILLLAYRGREPVWCEGLAHQAAEAILQQQRPSGGWSVVPEGPADVSVSVQAYFALKLAGHAASDESLSLARRRIRELGGADAADATTRCFLALFGQVDYDLCPPPQSMPSPLGIVLRCRPVRDVGLARGVRELFVEKPCHWPVPSATMPAASNVPRRIRWPRWAAAVRGRFPGKRGAARQLEWLRRTPVANLGFEELVWHTIALEAAGLGPESREWATCEARLRELVVVDDEESVGPQPATSRIVDTAMTASALVDSGLDPGDAVLREAVAALGWEESIKHGDPCELAWLLSMLAAAEPTLARRDGPLPPRIQMASNGSVGASDLPGRHTASPGDAAAAIAVARRIVERLCDLQDQDGSWGGNAPDVTGAVLAALSRHNLRLGHAAVDRAMAWLRDAQQADGGWDSATGVRFVHGTSQAIRGLVAAGVPQDDPDVAAGVNWLLVHQQPSGGWGESVPAGPPDTSANPAIRHPDGPELTTHPRQLYESHPPTATQTAWALLALLVAVQAKHEATRRGVQFLLDTQEEDGSWDEPHFTLRHQTDGPWQRSELHSVVWPVMALSRWAVDAAEAERDQPETVCLRLVDAPPTP